MKIRGSFGGAGMFMAENEGLGGIRAHPKTARIPGYVRAVVNRLFPLASNPTSTDILT